MLWLQHVRGEVSQVQSARSSAVEVKMQGVFIGIVMMTCAMVITILPLAPWWKVLVAAVYGAIVGWGLMRWKNKQ